MTTAYSAATADDESFIYSSWLKSFRDSHRCTDLSNALYYRSQSALIKQLLDGGAQVVVARSPEDSLVIRGYAVGDRERGELHYVYVKSMWRRQGIATALVSMLGPLKTFTHAREPAGVWFRRMGLVYDGRLFGSPRQERLHGNDQTEGSRPHDR